MEANPWAVWPPTESFLRDAYLAGWTKQALANFFGKDIAEIDKLLKKYDIRRPPKPIGQSRIPRNNHAGDGYWVYCIRCRHKHILCNPKPEGCSFGYVKKANQFNEHLLNLRDGHKCYACGYNPKEHHEEEWRKSWGQKRRLEMQHILPRSKGGSNCLHNLIWLCLDCHRKLAKNRVYGGIPSGTKDSNTGTP